MNIFKQCMKSLYSPYDIAKFRFQGIGKTILYVFFISFLSIIPISIFTAQTAKDAVSIFSSVIEQDLPAFTIENGMLHSDAPDAITIEKENLTIIFDSTGSITEGSLKNKDNTVAILKDEFLIVAGGQIQGTPYSMFSPLSITEKDVSTFVSQMDSALPIILFLVILFIFIIGSGMKFIEVSVLALFGLVLKNIASHQLQYRHLWRIAAYAVTLPTIFFTLMAALKTTVPASFLLNWFVSITILFLTLKEIQAANHRVKKSKN